MGALGKSVHITHGSNYLTVYAHLSRFSRGLRTSSKVKKGQVIGYVGSTGQYINNKTQKLKVKSWRAWIGKQ
jgi:murein DD-endopeptidase MepM/ murein hydrolase activator NlpD